jgi:membrane-bound serine protease (ClpP class)
MDTLANALWGFLTTPIVAYLLLVVGLWSLAMAVSIPGTGLPEGAAVISLALALIGLSQLPVNFAGILLMGLALLLFVLEFRVTAHGALLGAGALAFAAGSLLLFRTEPGQPLLLPVGLVALVTITSTAGFGALVAIGLRSQHLPTVQNPDRVVGQSGTAETEIRENGGSVYAAGESWSARAEKPIPAGSQVVVKARHGLWLAVAPEEKTD